MVPKISVVTISFNQASFLEQALASVIQQRYDNLEYIVVDAGSSDGSRAIIERYRPYLAHVVFESDRGPADGLNKGFALASGDIFSYLNADDLFLPDCLRKVAAAMTTTARTDVLLGDGIMCDENGRTLRRLCSTPWSLRAYAYGGAVALQPATFISARSFRQTLGFNVENKTCWDGELLVNLAKGGARFSHLPEPLAAFRLHKASITGSQRLDTRYRVDAERLFISIVGRRRNSSDVFFDAYYRLRKLAFRFYGW
jgi:glycosyltransferase involved in cell wall biosynthesis